MPGAPAYVEVGRKRVFAGALEWPGWCRSARDEEGALRALLEYASRYKAVVGRRFAAPATLEVIERLEGNATTDFGAPGAVPALDREPLDAAGLARQRKLLRACWAAFDASAAAAKGTSLRTGPRGGGRPLAKIVDHVLDAERAYVSKLGGALRGPAGVDVVRAAVLEALAARVRGEPPRSRVREPWPPRYFVRRSAWHALDHAWEIEDRAT